MEMTCGKRDDCGGTAPLGSLNRFHIYPKEMILDQEILKWARRGATGNDGVSSRKCHRRHFLIALSFRVQT